MLQSGFVLCCAELWAEVSDPLEQANWYHKEYVRLETEPIDDVLKTFRFYEGLESVTLLRYSNYEEATSLATSHGCSRITIEKEVLQRGSIPLNSRVGYV